MFAHAGMVPDRARLRLVKAQIALVVMLLPQIASAARGGGANSWEAWGWILFMGALLGIAVLARHLLDALWQGTISFLIWLFRR